MRQAYGRYINAADQIASDVIRRVAAHDRGVLQADLPPLPDACPSNAALGEIVVIALEKTTVLIHHMQECLASMPGLAAIPLGPEGTARRAPWQVNQAQSGCR